MRPRSRRNIRKPETSAHVWPALASRSALAGISESWRAASRGAREAGGRVYGIVMNQFKHEPNRYLTDKVATNHFYDRLQNLIERSVGFVALRGGMGPSQRYRWFGTSS